LTVEGVKMLSIHTHQTPIFLIYKNLFFFFFIDQIYIQVSKPNDKGFEYRLFDLGPKPFNYQTQT